MVYSANRINGVDIEQLAGTFNLIKENPSLGVFKFRAQNTWVGGTRSFTEVKEFSQIGGDVPQGDSFIIDGDRLPDVMGKNNSPNAVAYILHALASSLTVGLTYTAAAWGIICDSLQIELEGRLDMQGFLGLSETIRPGFQEIKVRAIIDCANKTETYLDSLKALSEHVQRTSPVLDMLRNPVTVNVELIEASDL